MGLGLQGYFHGKAGAAAPAFPVHNPSSTDLIHRVYYYSRPARSPVGARSAGCFSTPSYSRKAIIRTRGGTCRAGSSRWSSVSCAAPRRHPRQQKAVLHASDHPQLRHRTQRSSFGPDPCNLLSLSRGLPHEPPESKNPVARHCSASGLPSRRRDSRLIRCRSEHASAPFGPPRANRPPDHPRSY